VEFGLPGGLPGFPPSFLGVSKPDRVRFGEPCTAHVTASAPPYSLRSEKLTFRTVGSSHIEGGGGLNMRLLFQALSKTRNLSLTTSIAHSKTVLSYY
jgi:hypothetical protein